MSRVALSIYDDVGNPHYGGGGPRIVHRIARELAAEHEVRVYVGSYRGSGRHTERDGIRYTFVPVGWAGPRAGQLLFVLVLPLVVLLSLVRGRAKRPAAWIESLTPPASASLLPLAGRLVGTPVAGLVQMLSGADMQLRYKLPFEAVERLGLRLYRHVVTLNDVDARIVRAASPRTEVTVIPNAIDPPADVVPGPGTGRALFLGRVDVRQKGLDLLVEALAGSGVELDLAGSGTAAEEEKLRALVPPGVRLLGRVEGRAKEELLRDCAFLVVPSRYETFCLTALEAMAYGRPVVHFGIERNGWIGGGAGIAVPPFEVEALRAAIVALHADPALRTELGAGALRRSAEFDWVTVGGRYRELVAGLVGSRTGPGTGSGTGQRRSSRLRTAESRSRVSSDNRATIRLRSSVAATTAARWADPVRRFGNSCIRTCSRVPLARSALYASFSPSRSSSPTDGAAKA